MRNFGLEVRAGGPRRSQASSLRSSCWRRLLARGRLAVALGPGQHVGRVAALVLVDRRRRRPPTCAVQTASRNQRSWVTTSSEPRRAARWRASQSTPSTSRWLVGSSSSSSSGASSSSAASAMRRRSPPDSGPIGVSSPCGEARAARRRRAARRAPRGSARRRPTRGRRGRRRAPARIVRAGVELVAPGRAAPTSQVAGARDARRRRAPRRPAISRSSVDLPSPLRPTTPIRSPAATPSVTSRSTERLP